MRGRRRAAEDGRGGQLARHALDQRGRAPAPGSSAEAAPQPRAREPLERLLVVRVAAERPTSGRLSTSETPKTGTRAASSRSSSSASRQPCDALVSSSDTRAGRAQRLASATP